jgi:hypothetical protein
MDRPAGADRGRGTEVPSILLRTGSAAIPPSAGHRRHRMMQETGNHGTSDDFLHATGARAFWPALHRSFGRRRQISKHDNAATFGMECMTESATRHGFRGRSNKNTGREFLGGSHPIAVQRPMPDREVGSMVSALTRQMMATDAR